MTIQADGIVFIFEEPDSQCNCGNKDKAAMQRYLDRLVK